MIGKTNAGGLVPSGTIQITQNGTTNVKTYEFADVNVSGGDYNIEQVIDGDECTLNITTSINSQTLAEFKKMVERSSNSITLPDGTTKIGAYAFYNWTDNIAGTGNGLTNIILPNSLLSIEKYAFSGLGQLTNVSFGNSLTTIGDCAFQYTSINSTQLPNSITTINASAFSGCVNLKITQLPTSLTTIGNGAFSNSGIQINSLPSTIYSFSASAFSGCTGIVGKFVWNTSYMIVQGSLFYGCTNLTEFEYQNVNSSSNRGQISNSAFSNSGLTKISFPNATFPVTLQNKNAFPNGVNWTGTIEVPSALLNTWKTATNWDALVNATWVGI